MFTTNPVLLKTLIDQVETGKIQLPDFQRGWIWDDARIRGLLASISKGFPVGAVMTLSAGSDIKLKARPIEGIDAKAVPAPDFFLLDGQQRLTTLYQSLRHPEAVDTSDSKRQKVKRWYYIDMLSALDPLAEREDAIISVPDTRKVTEDFGRKIIRDLSTPNEEYRQHMIPSESLMDPMNWMLGYLAYWNATTESHPHSDALEFFKQFQVQVHSNFTSYQLPVINLDAETPKEAVCTVFEKVNTGGVLLNVFELATASFAADAENFSLRDDWDVRRNRMRSFSGVLQGIEGDQFLQAIALLKTQQDRRSALHKGVAANLLPAVGCKKRDILDLSLADYHYWADRVEKGFLDAAEFLNTQFVFGHRNVPYTTQLVPLSALYVELGKELESGIALGRLERWYWAGVFGEMYGGASESQFALDLVEVAEFVRQGLEPRLISEATFAPQRLVTLHTRQSAAYKGVYALQMKNQAKDWRTTKPLSIATYREQNIDIHHIFPVAWCKDDAKPEIPRRLYDSVINKTPIDAYTNKIIGRKPPSEYLRLLRRTTGDAALGEILAAHWIDVKHLQEDDFAAAFVARGGAMLDLIGQAMGADLGDGRAVFTNTLSIAGLIPDQPSEVSETLDTHIEDEEEFDEIGESEDDIELAEAAC